MKAIVSHDIDFVTNKRAVDFVAGLDSKYRDYKLVLSDPFDPSINLAKLSIPIPENPESPVGIDFLVGVHGVSSKEIMRDASEAKIHGVQIKVLSSFLLIKSRLSNLYGLGYGPEKAKREVQRIGVAIRVYRTYIKLLLDKRERRKALNGANNILDLAASRLGVRAFSVMA